MMRWLLLIVYVLGCFTACHTTNEPDDYWDEETSEQEEEADDAAADKLTAAELYSLIKQHKKAADQKYQEILAILKEAGIPRPAPAEPDPESEKLWDQLTSWEYANMHASEYARMTPLHVMTAVAGFLFFGLLFFASLSGYPA